MQEKLGVIPKNKSSAIRKLANFDENRILEIEEKKQNMT